MAVPDRSRRDFVKRGAYVAPAILTLAAAPAFAKPGSIKPAPPGKPEKPGKPDNPGKPGKGGH
ncbi:hypothetical protein [uncultured Azohydromonas sp.]|jgi:hypothetical protein|uniref:hypothetical protein n=1 Tax=uncultured Azohydromonas sp. TaxID=487342 RepID=UPI00262A6A64|nr:hypothetical protein [uncultured Azohydromonas sp.]